jgi:hypothetical protein
MWLKAWRNKWGILAALAIWFAFEWSMSWFATCQPNDYATGYQHSYPEHCTALSGPLSSLIRSLFFWTDVFLKSREQEIVALFTVVLAVSTIGLWIVTNRAAKAAQIAAEHIPTVEGAFVYAILIAGDRAHGVLESAAQGARLDIKFTVQFSVRNYGKTPAVIRAGWAMLSVGFGSTMVQSPLFQLPANTVIGAGDQLPVNPMATFSVQLPLTPTQAQDVIRSQSPLILHGGVLYTDIWGKEWQLLFDGRYDTGMKRFRLDNRARQKIEYRRGAES